MSESLQEQLIKAGLIKPEQTKSTKGKSAAVKNNKSKKKPLPKKTVSSSTPVKEDNREQLAKKALKLQVRELVNAHQQNNQTAEKPYYFAHCGKAKRIFVTEEQYTKLSEGQLAITVLDKNHYIIPAEIGLKIKEMGPQYAVYLHDPNEIDDFDIGE